LAAQRKHVVLGDAANIAETLPFLFPPQHEDVLKAEIRLMQPDGYGILFANGTGTGKTYTGVGIINRLLRAGKKNGLIVVPGDEVYLAWVEAAKNLGIPLNQLESTKDPGRGVSITTYANLATNLTLADREYDFVFADESHALMANKDAETTEGLKTFRAITNHPDGRWKRAEMKHRRVHSKLMELQDRAREKRVDPHLIPGFTEIAKEWGRLSQEVYDQVLSIKPEDRSRVVFLSATPWAYEKNLQYSAGYLFEYPKATRTGYNEPDGFDLFMVSNFGWRMRNGLLTEPGPEVDRGLLQRAFSERLVKEGVLSRRMLDVEADYDRRFVMVPSAIGNKIDEGLEFLREAGDGMYRPLYDIISKDFNFLARSRLLEALKAKEAIPFIQQNLDIGRKVVIYYDYNQGGSRNVFNVDHLLSSSETITKVVNNRPVTIRLADLAVKFKRERPDLSEMETAALSPLATLTAAFPQARQINGLESKNRREEALRQFNSDENKTANVLLVQKAIDKGWSGHDSTGAHRRVLINLGLPTAPVTAIQQEGRIYRVGQVSDASFRYFNTGTNWERAAFAQRIAERAATVENLGMGDLARNLKDSFIIAFQESGEFPPSAEDGKGGKQMDRAIVSGTDFDRAKTFYFMQRKRDQRTKAREGSDYFATPEPLGLKMVEWAGIRPGEAVLEPSAGHGAIARWFPENNPRTVVEPSLELSSRLALLTNARMVDGTFESLDIVNKYDAIVMNPPFANGQDIEHILHARSLLLPRGRLVALCAGGPRQAQRLKPLVDACGGAWQELPAGTFEGTDVRAVLLTIEAGA
jgi:hypothetical protein